MTSRRALYAAGLPLGACVTRPRFGGGYVCGGGGGGDSSSSSASTNTTANTTNTYTETTTNNADKRLVVDANGTGVTGDNNVVSVSNTSADPHVVDMALATVRDTISGAAKATQQATEDALGSNLATTDAALSANLGTVNATVGGAYKSLSALTDAAGTLFDKLLTSQQKQNDSQNQIQGENIQLAQNLAQPLNALEQTNNKNMIAIAAVAGVALVTVAMMRKK